MQGRATGVKDDVPVLTELGAMLPECFTKTPFNAVSHDGPPQRARDGKAETHARGAARVRARQTKRREHRTGEAEAVVIDHSKIGGAQHPGRSGKGKRAATGGFIWRGQCERLSRR